MSDDITGYVEAAEVLDTIQEPYEQSDEIAGKLPDGFRVIEVSSGEGFRIERATNYCPKWVPVAKFTNDDAKYEWADEIQDGTDGEYRCVIDRTGGDVWLEVLVDDE